MNLGFVVGSVEYKGKVRTCFQYRNDAGQDVQFVRIPGRLGKSFWRCITTNQNVPKELACLLDNAASTVEKGLRGELPMVGVK